MLKNIVLFLIILLLLRWFFPEINAAIHHGVETLIALLDSFITSTVASVPN